MVQKILTDIVLISINFISNKYFLRMKIIFDIMYRFKKYYYIFEN